MITTLFETVRLSVLILLRNLYNSLRSLKETAFSFQVIVILCAINNIPRDDHLTLMETFDDLYTVIRLTNKR